MSEFFRKPKSLGVNVIVALDLFDYAAKADLNNEIGVDTSGFAKKTDLASSKPDVGKLHIDKLKNVLYNLSNLKNKVDKLDIGKLETTPGKLSKLSNVVKMMVLKRLNIKNQLKTFYNINTTDTTNLVKRTDNNTKINETKKITDHDHSNKNSLTHEFNKLTSENFAARLAQANLASKNDIANFLKRQILMIN